MARTPKYRDDAREVILAGLADGRSLREVCRTEKNMPSLATVMDWCVADKDFAEQYARARSIGSDSMAEDLHAIADDPNIPSDQKRIMVDARKWILAKRQPKKYGEKLDLGIGQSEDRSPVNLTFKIVNDKSDD